MSLTTEQIEQYIANHKTTLNTDYRQYLSMLDIEDTPTTDVAEILENADGDNDEFNLGYEQGYLNALTVLLNLSKIN